MGVRIGQLIVNPREGWWLASPEGKVRKQVGTLVNATTGLKPQFPVKVA